MGVTGPAAPGGWPARGCGAGARAALVLAAILIATPCVAVPPRPDLLETHRGSAALSGLASRQAAARRRGLDQPNPVPPLPGGTARTKSGRPIDLHIPVLLVDFADNIAADRGPQVAADYERLFFSEGALPTGSMREYYLETSYGELGLTGQVSGWHRMPQTYSFYTAGASGLGTYPRNARRLAEDAVRTADNLDPGLDFSLFDRTGPDGVPDGILDGLLIVHAGRGAEETLSPGQIHSHFWTPVDPDLIVDGVRAATYLTGPQDGRIGVFAHEFGHNLGLPDLYDTDANATATMVGVWSIMGFGSWLDRNGNTFGADSGTRPSHFDAWSKIELGFVTPLNLTSNSTGVLFEPAETTPRVVRLWTNGSASGEHFLIEQRASRGFDEGLPFCAELPCPPTAPGGLLVWHVDEEAGTNNDPDRLLVALAQADGRRDMEFGFNHGDRGDPFLPGDRLTADSTPSSRANDGNDSQVRIEGIEVDLGAGTFTAELTVETAPAIRRGAFTLDDTGGNRDGGLDPGESVAIDLEVRNIGIDATELSVALTSEDPAITVAGGPAQVGALPADSTAIVTGVFTLTAGELPGDPHPVPLTLHYQTGGSVEEETLLLVAGNRLGYQSTFETTASRRGWTHESGRSGYHDDWHLSATRAFSGSVSWHCAPPGQVFYQDQTDALLISPVLALDGQAQLAFRQWLDVEAEEGGRAWDGGLVEISIAGGAWEPIEPVGGYPYRIIRNQASPISARGVFSGSADWHPVEFDLSGYEGAARLRFRFGTDAAITAEGWYVDDVVVVSRELPYLVDFARPRIEDGVVELRWEVREFFDLTYNGRGFNVYRRPLSAGFPLGLAATLDGFVQLNPVPLPASQPSYLDTDVAAAESYAYLLEDLRREGDPPERFGPQVVLVPGGGPSPRVVRIIPHPYRPAAGALTIQVVVPAVGAQTPTRLGVYNGSGRLVRRVFDGFLSPGKNELRWDGRGLSGVPAPAGVYFLRLEAAGRASSRTLTLLR